MLNPLLLLFLPLALAPVLLHLITLYRTKTVELSTFRFLMDSYVRQRQRIRLLEYLVMLLRFLFVLLIVLALSRPVIERFGWLFGGHSGKDVTLIVDASASMNVQTGGESSLTRAKAVASTILNLLTDADHVTLIAAADRPKVIAQGYVGQKDALLAAVDALEPSAGDADLPLAIQQAVETPQRGPRSLYLLSDGQASTWRTLAGAPVLAAVDPATQVVLMNVGPTESVDNIGVVGQPPRALRPIVGLPVALTATVVNNHRDKAQTVPLSVIIGDQQVRQVSLSVEPGEELQHTLSYTPRHAGLLVGRFEVPHDSFPDDDAFAFCLNVQPKMNVLLVTPDDAGSKTPADLYVRAALRSPLGAATGMLDEEKELAKAMELTSVKQSQASEAAIAAADVVLLLDVPMTKALAGALGPFLARGGGLLVMPGPAVNPQDYQRLLLDPASDASHAGQRIVMHEPTGDPDNEATFTPIASVDLTHPVFQVFAHDNRNTHAGGLQGGEDSQGFRGFRGVRLFRYMPLSIEQAAPQDQVVGGDALGGERPRVLMRVAASSSAQDAALVEARVGRGTMMIASFAPTPQGSNLPLQPAFVPWLLRTVAYLRPPADVRLLASVEPGQPATVAIDDVWRSPQVQVTDPLGREHTLDLHREGRSFVGAWLNTDRKGVYKFDLTGQTVEGEATATLGLAVNLAPQASRLRFLDEPAMLASLAPVTPVYLKATASDTRLAEQLTQREEIWRYLIWAVFIIIGVEFLLSTLRTPGSSSTGSPASGGKNNIHASTSGSRVKQWLEWSGLLESIRGRQRMRKR